jgi:Raf kinase inhibitor-like YbhB/YbcL family protein
MKGLSRKTTIFIFLIFVLVLLIGVIVIFFFQRSPELFSNLTPQENMKISSPVFGPNQLIPKKYTCDGENINPPLKIEDTPKEAKSLVLIVDDPDAPVGTWDHWLVWNIDPKTEEINENSVPEKAVLGTNDFGKLPYGGPCPPSGSHRYFFKIYALDTILELPQGVKKEALVKAMENRILDQSELIGRYSR